MIPGVSAVQKRCDRPEVHRPHVWVTSPTSRIDHACDGQPVERAEVLFDLAVSAA